MEVLQRSGLLYPLPTATMYPPGSMPRVFPSTSELYSCYPFEANTPSRTPTPEQHPGRFRKSHQMDISSHATTLQSVLRGEIPPAYSHLTNSSASSTSSSTYSSSSPLNHYSDFPAPLLHPAPSPCPSHHSSISHSPRPQSHESHTSQDSDVQSSPLDLSCKKISRKRTAVSAFLNSSQHSSHNSILSGVLSSSLPAKFSTSTRQSSTFPSSYEHSSSSSSSSSPSVAPMHTFPPSPSDGQHGEEFSLLRNLLSVGKNHMSPSAGSLHGSSPNLSSPERGCDSPASESSFPRVPITPTTRVQLAKKNLFPVSARVSDWLVKLVRFAKSIPEFSSLSHNDKVTLIHNAWSRLLLLYMAESNFQFAVTPIHTPVTESVVSDAGPTVGEPTMKSVEAVQTFINKCQQMGVEPKEYEYLRMLVLFNSGYVGLSCPQHVDRLTSVVQQLLQQHVRSSRPADVMHYSRLLMCLPSLYGFNAKMLETFFCRHISKNTDMEVLLKELLQSNVE